MNINQAMTGTLKTQREVLVIEPIHAELAPVKAYAKEIGELKKEPFCVVSIPKGSVSYLMGYRFASIPMTELDYYIENGANLAE